MNVKTWRQTKKNARRRIGRIIKSYENDAAEQLAIVRAMINNADSADIQALALIALATENAAKTVHKMYLISSQEGSHGMAQSPA
ncbi:MAG: hypothetical protein KJ630_01930 [Proteobacteria bacterium]|nr:hypothetical protein [Pseudomonadota bacterium]